MATWYVDLEGSAGAANGTSFANRSSDLATIVNAATNGDVVRIKASTDPVSIGSCTWTQNSTVTIPAGTIKNLYSDGAWVGATNVTGAANVTTTLRKEGASATSLSFGAGFTTGRAAYYQLGSSQDLSAYSKISLWFRSSVAIANANIYSIALCSDTSGTSVVNNLTLPSVGIAASTFVPLVLDNGGALGSSIQSVALYTTADPGVPVLYIDNLFATNSLSLRSLISKNTSGEAWYCIRSAVDTTLTLDMGVSSAVNVATKGYPGTTETVTTYVSNGIDTIPVATATTTNIYLLSKAATAASPVTISGGWSRTDMATRTGSTHMVTKNVLGRMLSLTGSNLIFEYLLLSHSSTCVLVAGDGHVFNYCHFTASTTAGITSSGTLTRFNLSNCSLNHHATAGYSATIRLAILDYCKAELNSADGFQLLGNLSSLTNSSTNNNVTSGVYTNGHSGLTIGPLTAAGNNYALELTSLLGLILRGIQATNNVTAAIYVVSTVATCYGLTTSGNGTGGGTSISDGGALGTFFYIYNWSKSEGTPIATSSDYEGNQYISINENNNSNTHAIYLEGATIASDTSVRRTNSGISWKLSPTSAARISTYPLAQRIRGIPVKANITHTVSLWARRDNTGLDFTFGIDDQSVSGVSAQSVSMTAAANTWEKLTLTITPTVDAVLDFYVKVYGGTTYNGYWDDFEVIANSKNDVSAGDYGYVGNGVYVSSFPREMGYAFTA